MVQQKKSQSTSFKKKEIPESLTVWGVPISKADIADYIFLLESGEYISVEGRMKVTDILYQHGLLVDFGEPKFQDVSDGHRTGVMCKAVVLLKRIKTSEDGTITYEPITTRYGTACEFWGASEVNQNYAIENAETSAIGRALGYLLTVGGIESANRMRQLAKNISPITNSNNTVDKKIPISTSLTIEEVLEEISILSGKVKPETYTDILNEVGVTQEEVSVQPKIAYIVLSKLRALALNYV